MAREARNPRVSVLHKIFFASVAALALRVGYTGYFNPKQIDSAIPWLVPPLHARFLGSMYLAGGICMVLCILFVKRWAEVRVICLMIAIWTGILFSVSLFYLDQFDFARIQPWIWFGAYLIFPLIALWLAWRYWSVDRMEEDVPSMDSWARGAFMAFGAAAVLLGLVLLVATPIMVTAWPWKITPMLAQIYSAPLLSYGIGSLLLSRQRTWKEVRWGLPLISIFVTGVFIASIIHKKVFAPLGISASLWLGGFGAAAITMIVLTFAAFRPRAGGSPIPSKAAA
jgi:hypothetical protein